MTQLNQGQHKAVYCESDKIVCLAGAGTGKTFALLSRIRRLIEEGADPQSMLVLTFTNAAAQNMRDRFNDANCPEFMTFHAFCYSLITNNLAVRKQLGYTEVPRIVSDAEYKLIMNRAKLDSGVKLNTKQMLGENLKTQKDKFEYTIFNKFLTRLMVKEGLITFDKLCYDVCQLFTQDNGTITEYKNRYKYIFCDEMQDTDMRQWEFIESFKTAKLFVVGDALQNLYSFRGTTSEIIKGLASNPEWTSVRLTENYRSSKPICDFANNMSHYADGPYRIEIESTRGGHNVVTATVASLDKWVETYVADNAVTAILCRTNREVDMIRKKYSQYSENYNTYAKLCKSAGLYRSCINEQYRMIFLSQFLSREEYSEFLRQLSVNPDMSIEQFRTLFNNNRVADFDAEISEMYKVIQKADTKSMELLYIANYYGIDGDAVIKVSSNIETEDDVLHALSILAEIYKTKTATLYVGTIHSAKGLEYDNVILYGVDGAAFPLNCEDNWNLYYVGITRAKQNLCILRGGLNEQNTSDREISENIVEPSFG